MPSFLMLCGALLLGFVAPAVAIVLALGVLLYQVTDEVATEEDFMMGEWVDGAEVSNERERSE